MLFSYSVMCVKGKVYRAVPERHTQQLYCFVAALFCISFVVLLVLFCDAVVVIVLFRDGIVQ
jgi:hypothetical protein